MTDSAKTTAELDPLTREALAWVVRLRSGESTAADAEALQRWLDQSPAHAEAFRQAARLWRLLGPAARELSAEAEISTTLVPQPPTRRLISRRSLLGGAVAASAVAYVVVRPPFGLWPSLVELSADYRTGKGEQRRVVLSDDISLALNTQTSIVVRSTPQEARIELISGEATIATNRTSSSPLVVDAADGRMVVARARFNALCEEGVVRVTCIEGEVDVEWRKQAVRLQPRQQVSYSPEGLGVSASVDPAEATAWQERLLIFRDRPLAEVIDEVNRYRPGRIIVTNAELARRLVNGTFHLDRLDDVVAQVRQLFGARVTSLPGGVVLLS